MITTDHKHFWSWKHHQTAVSPSGVFFFSCVKVFQRPSLTSHLGSGRMRWSWLQGAFKSSSLAGVFGQSLEETVLYERRYGVRLVPLVVEQCVTLIRERGMHEVGLFRQPGRASLVKELQEAFEAGERPTFDRCDAFCLHCFLITLRCFMNKTLPCLPAATQMSTRWRHCWSSTSDSCPSLWFLTVATRSSCSVVRSCQVTAHW